MEWKQFFKLCSQRLVENLLSVKVWMFLIPFTVSVILFAFLFQKNIEVVNAGLKLNLADPELAQIWVGSLQNVFDAWKNWLTFNISLIGTIVVVREVFKVKKLTALTNGGNNKEEIEKVKV